MAGHKGYSMTGEDRVVSDVIDQIMCQGRGDVRDLSDRHVMFQREIGQISRVLEKRFPKALDLSDGNLCFRPGMNALARVVAACVDTSRDTNDLHSAAV